MNPTLSPADTHLPADSSILSARYRATTIGMVALIALHAFEALAVAAAMPTVAEALDGLRLYARWPLAALATSVIGMTLAGCWADRHGPARPLWYGLGCFVLGLLLAGFATRMGMLVAGRLMQGLGAGAISVSLYVMVGRSYPEHLRPKVFAASAGWVVPSMVGPALSGLIVQHLGWRWVFLAVPLLAVPAALLLRPALARMQPSADSNNDEGRGNVVRWASGASLAALLLYFGGQQHGPTALLCIGVAMLALLLCVHRLLPAGTLILRRGLPSVIALRGIAAAAFFACEAYLPLLQRERGSRPAGPARCSASAHSVGSPAPGCRVTSSAAGHASSCCARRHGDDDARYRRNACGVVQCSAIAGGPGGLDGHRFRHGHDLRQPLGTHAFAVSSA